MIIDESGEYLVLDVETTMRGLRNSPSPWVKENDILLLGCARGELGSCSSDEFLVMPPEDFFPNNSFRGSLLVGHNIGFDLLHLAKRYGREPVIQWLKDNILFDTQIAHYMLSAQTEKMPSLGHSTSVFLGKNLKGDLIKDLVESGLTTEDCSIAQLTEYLKNDVLITDELFREQLKQLSKMEMLPLFWQEMRARATTLVMELNGISVSKIILDHYSSKLGSRRSHLRARLLVELNDLLPKIPLHDLNPDSDAQISTALFGGVYTYTKDTVQLDSDGTPIPYKTGKKKGLLKTKKEKVGTATSGFGLKAEIDWYLPKSDRFSTTNDVLVSLKAKSKAPRVKMFLTNLMEYRELEKELGTYVNSYVKILDSNEDGLVHPKFNHAITATGRLSCSDPNVQNLSNKKFDGVGMLDSFMSRTAVGCVIKVDFSQLEVCALAHLSGDTTLIKELNAGEDIHKNNAVSYYGRPITSAERKLIKEMSFQFQYGAGWKSLSKRWGLGEKDAKAFIDNYYNKYVGVREYHEAVKAVVEASPPHKYTEFLKPSSLVTMGGVTYIPKYGMLGSETGRLYAIKENVDSYGRTYFPPTAWKNYPVQGFATADLMKVALALLGDEFMDDRDVLLVNTVHDDIWFDLLDETKLEEVVERIKKVLDTLEEKLYNIYMIKLKVKINYEIETGHAFGKLNSYYKSGGK